MVEIAVPPAIISAIFALLFMLAWAQWGHGITGSLNIDLPYIGNVIGRYVGYALEGAYQTLVGWFDGAVGPVADLILRPLIALENTISSAVGAAENTYNALYVITTRTIPNAVGTSFNVSLLITEQYYNRAYGDALNFYNQATGYANYVLAYSQALFNRGVAYTDTAVGTLRSYVDGTAAALAGQLSAATTNLTGLITAGIGQAQAYTLRAYDAAISYSQTLALKAAADLATAATQLESYADATAIAATGVLATDLDTAISSTLAGIYTDVDGAVHDTIGLITTGDEDILSALQAFPASIPLDLAGLAALTGITSLTLARYLRDCGIPNCQNLSQLGRDLQAAIALVDDAAFLGLIFDLIHHPQSAAQEVESAVGDLISAGLTAGRVALSI